MLGARFAAYPKATRQHALLKQQPPLPNMQFDEPRRQVENYFKLQWSQCFIKNFTQVWLLQSNEPAVKASNKKFV